MKSDRGMETLMTVFSGIAALMCLLVGFQLLSLETQIGQAIDSGPTKMDQQFPLWKAQAHTGAIMSLGAAILVFLFGLRHHVTSGQARKKPPRDDDPAFSTVDLETVSVRVFEVDDEDYSVEITPSADDHQPPESRPLPSVPLPPGDHKLALEPDQEHMTDPTDNIIQSIRDAGTPGSGRSTLPPATGRFLPSFFGWIFRRRHHR